MTFFEFLGQFPFLTPVVALFTILFALGLWKLIREFLPW